MRCLDLQERKDGQRSGLCMQVSPEGGKNKMKNKKNQETRNRPEVCPEIQNLPHPQPDEKEGGAKAEPLDAVVGALVGVAQLLLPCPQVVHLADNLLDHLLHAPQVRLDGLELLRCLDRRPVLGVGADVDIELDVPVRVGELLGCLWGRQCLCQYISL